MRSIKDSARIGMASANSDMHSNNRYLSIIVLCAVLMAVCPIDLGKKQRDIMMPTEEEER